MELLVRILVLISIAICTIGMFRDAEKGNLAGTIANLAVIVVALIFSYK